jgi:hypothetical protein
MNSDDPIQPVTIFGMVELGPGDVVLRASVNGQFQVMDATTTQRLSGWLTFLDALAFAARHGATTIYEQPIDASGRILSEPRRLRCSA